MKKEKKLWFCTKRYGWGWRPCSMEGWLVTLGFIALVLATRWFYEGLLVEAWEREVLADHYGFSVMFLVAVALLFISLVPMFVMPHHTHKKVEVGWHAIFDIVWHHPAFASAVFFWYMAQATIVFFWPIYLFEQVGSLEEMGSVVSVAMLFSSVSIYFFWESV